MTTAISSSSTSAADPSIHRAIWDANAHDWDEAIGPTGNSFYRHLVAPTALSLLSVQPSDNVLELACGNGIFSRRLAALGARVLATDFSPAMIELARSRTGGDEAKRVAYRTLDLTVEKELDGLVALSSNHCGFDAVVCNMALMDVCALEPLAFALPRLLKSDGRFVATIMHPAFNSLGTQRYAETYEDPVTGRGGTRHSVRVSRYLDIPSSKGEAISGQTEAQYYFHRPLNGVLAPFFANGMVMDGFEEPAFEPPSDDPGLNELSWQNYSQIPPVLGFRLAKGRHLE